MMKRWVLIWVLMVAVCPVFADEMEVRWYRMGEVELKRVHREMRWERDEEVTFDAYDQAGWLGEMVAKPGFESRFFEKGGVWVDCSERVKEILGEGEFSGVALMEVERRELVMKSEVADHEGLAVAVRRDTPKTIRVEAMIYEVPGVVAGTREIGARDLPEGAKRLGGLSVLAVPGQVCQARSADGKLSAEWEMQIDDSSEIAELRMDLKGGLDGGRFGVRDNYFVPLGMPWVVELGSRDGKTSLIAVMTVELVLLDGTREDAWVLKEEGGEFLREQRLRAMRGVGKVERDQGEVREYRLPPTFLTFITNAVDVNDDPFAADGSDQPVEKAPVFKGREKELRGLGRLLDLRILLQENGVSFREGDWAVWSQARSTLYAKLSAEQFEFLEGIVGVGEDSPWMIRVDFEQVDEGGVILKKIGVLAVPGQTAGVGLGRDLRVEVEAQIDANDTIEEVRMTLRETKGDLKKPSFATGLTLRDGIPVVVQTSEVGEKKKSWRVTATIVKLDEVVERYLNEKK